MKRKRSYLPSAAILTACVGISLGALAMQPPHSGVTKVNFDRIEVAMTDSQVEGYFGKPGGEILFTPPVKSLKVFLRSSGAAMLRSPAGPSEVTISDKGEHQLSFRPSVPQKTSSK